MADVSDYEIRLVEPDEYRVSADVFLGAMHHAPITDERWELTLPSYEPGRTFGAYHSDAIVGTTASFASRLAVPGGGVLPMAMVTKVGVRSDHTRRGVLTGLMRTQLGALAEPFATLRASEGGIYGRFGYGVATRGRTMTIKRARAACRPDAPTGGRVRLVELDEAIELMPEIYRRTGPMRPGWACRDGYWWNTMRSWMSMQNKPVRFAIHRGTDGDDGFAVYYVERDHQNPTVLGLDDLMAGSQQAWVGLWRFLCTVDLVDEIRAHLRPLDEPLEELLADRRAVTTSAIDDETWLRIVDVPRALAARTFGAVSGRSESMVVEVRDSLLPANSGRYRIGDGPARPVGEPAELVLDAAALATVYLGDVPPSALAYAGRVTAIEDDAVAMADRLFAVPTAPWCGTYF